MATIALMVYGQLIIKWQVMRAGAFPAEFGHRAAFLAGLMLNPWILSALFAAFIAAMFWMLALSKLPLSHAYPFVSVSFVLVLVLSNAVLGEPMGWAKIVGSALIVLGVGISTQSW